MRSSKALEPDSFEEPSTARFSLSCVGMVCSRNPVMLTQIRGIMRPRPLTPPLYPRSFPSVFAVSYPKGISSASGTHQQL